MHRTAANCEEEMYIFTYYCIQKRACELKVCSGWFGLREHEVSLPESICRRPAAFNERRLISFSPAWVSLIPRRPSCRLRATKCLQQQLNAHEKGSVGVHWNMLLCFFFKSSDTQDSLLSSRDERQSPEDLLQPCCFNYIWVTLLQENHRDIDPLVCFHTASDRVREKLFLQILCKWIFQFS